MMLNPILERELKSKMRSWKTPIMIIVYLFFIGMITYVALISMNVSRHEFFNPKAAANVFDFISVFQLALIMFIVPMITAASISGERERQTLDLMLCTDIPAMTIIYGKIFSALSSILLLALLATPFLSFSFLMGGIGILDVLKIIIYYIVSAFYLSTIAMYTSTKFKKNKTSILMSYVIMGILYITPFVLLMGLLNGFDNYLFHEFFRGNEYLVSAILFGANPVFGMLSLTSNNFFNMGDFSSQYFPALLDVPSWIISIIWFALISVFMLWRAKKNLYKNF